MPLLRVAADEAGLSSEEVRRLSTLYAYPKQERRKVITPDALGGGGSTPPTADSFQQPRPLDGRSPAGRRLPGHTPSRNAGGVASVLGLDAAMASNAPQRRSVPHI